MFTEKNNDIDEYKLINNQSVKGIETIIPYGLAYAFHVCSLLPNIPNMRFWYGALTRIIFKHILQ